MKILAVDTSGNTGSVAVSQDGTIVGEYTINYKKTHSQTLMPMIDQLIKIMDMDIREFDAFAVSKGPGSFTGLRIGSASVKGFAQALNKPVIAVPTLEALAYNYYGSQCYVCPIMDARRGQVYTGLFEYVNEPEKTKLLRCIESTAMSIEELITRLNNYKDKAIVFLGDAVTVHEEYIKNNISVDYSFAVASNCLQRAASVALLAEEMYAEGKYESAAEHSPEYLRMSQAERERMEKASQGN